MAEAVIGSPGLAITLVQTMINSGVSEVVLAPGSRNAGLALALSAADRAGRLRLHVRLDERSAGFFALGLAKATGEAVAVVTTSGTAVANLHPAVAEAWHAGVPLVVMSADRPLSMRDSGANQTTRQAGLLSPHVLDCCEIASESGGPQQWSRQLARGLTLARGLRTRRRGPVQLNLGLAQPLLDERLLDQSLFDRSGLDECGLKTSARAQDVGGAVPLVAAARPATATRITRAPGTVVIAGDATPAHGAAARRCAEELGVPLLAEPSSNARAGALAIAGYRDLLGTELADQISRVLVFGHPTLSRPVTALLSRPDVSLIVVSDTADWVDSGWAADAVIDAVEVSDEPATPADQAWLSAWQAADRERTTPAWGGRAAVCAVVARLAADQVVVWGSSNPIRHADLAPIQAAPPLAFGNRGLSGIDGTISTALGVRTGLDRPTTVVLGDLTFLHDLTGLVRGDHEPDPGLRLVVIDDHGGGIFASLEQAAPAYADHFERVFATPQAVDLAAVARGLGASVEVVTTEQQLQAALAQPHPVSGYQVIVVTIAATKP